MTLDNFITIEEGKSPQRIQRENGDRINHVKASVIPGVTTTEIQKIVEQTLSENLVLPDSVKIQYQGEARDIESFGGAFIIVEKVLGNSAKIDDLFVKEYYNLKQENGYTQEQIANKRKSLEGVLVPLTSSFNEHLLHQVGFKYVDCFFRCLNFAGWIAIK